MDGTLYCAPELRKKYADAAYQTLSHYKKLDPSQARIIVEEKKKELEKQAGGSMPYTLTLKSLGVPIEVWHKENIKYVDPGQFLVPDMKLKKTLKFLKKEYKLAIFTNNNDIQTERVIQALNLKSLFDRVFTYNSFKLLKPDPEFFRRAMAQFEARPEECLIVGDRYNVDLAPARNLGMQIYEVKGPRDIIGSTSS
ncbi:hypothetical protein BXT86_05130 [candidate division WOR-3 bacterium 4484_100]|uniref:HAD family hydrolase n=1 Tax=candidate division WOR-3 bacterium 4484_100 TaxID=1936077 RepID=A0A1V4QFP1_UNCW3|nr:MAG: hypothetical protein BXT86_05130 [candidate division WOR-3 bacterium 4484_100]